MSTRFLPPLLAALFLVSHVTRAQDRSDTERERAVATLETMSELSVAISSYMIDENYYPVINEDSDIYEVLAEYIGRPPLVDAWGTSLIISSEPYGYTIVSAGADRMFQSLPATGGSRSWNADIILRNGGLKQWPSLAIDYEYEPPRDWDCRENGRRIRIIAAALELYRAAYGSYPEATSIEELEGMLSPSFAGDLPTRDAWGSPFEISISSRSWHLTSRGRDGLLDHERPKLARLLPRDDVDRSNHPSPAPAGCPRLDHLQGGR